MTNQQTNVVNRAKTTLTSPFSAGATTLNVSSTAAFPAVPFYVVISPEPSSSTTEVVLVDGSKTGTTMVLSGAGLRGQDGTTDQAHADGAVVAVVPVAALWADINDRVDASYNPGGTDVAVADGGTGASTAAAARTNLGVVTDHGGLTGLGDDDHPQYAKLVGDTFTGAVVLPASDPTTDNQASRKAYVDGRVLKAGDTMTGNLIVPGVQLGMAAGLGASGVVNLDLNADDFATIGALTGNVTFTTSNRGEGSSVTVRVINGTTLRTLAFPADWKFVGEKPTDIAASKTGVLAITAFGTTDADVVAAWAVEE